MPVVDQDFVDFDQVAVDFEALVAWAALAGNDTPRKFLIKRDVSLINNNQTLIQWLN